MVLASILLQPPRLAVIVAHACGVTCFGFARKAASQQNRRFFNEYIDRVEQTAKRKRRREVERET